MTPQTKARCLYTAPGTGAAIVWASFVLRMSACLDLLSVSILGSLSMNELMKSRGTLKPASRWSKQRPRNRSSHLKRKAILQACQGCALILLEELCQEMIKAINMKSTTLPFQRRRDTSAPTTAEKTIFLPNGAERAAEPHAKPGPDSRLSLGAKNSSKCTRHLKHRD